MGKGQAFVLADVAGGAVAFEDPSERFVAHRPDEVAAALDGASGAARAGAAVAGCVAYEAGLALEPALAAHADGRAGAAGPLVWLARFERETRLEGDVVEGWLAERAADGPAALGPLVPSPSPGGYEAAFDRLREAISAGDVYQTNLTYPQTGSYRGDPRAIYAALRRQGGGHNAALMFDGADWLLSLSPERFVERCGAALTVRPMKGTRPRSADPVADAEAARELAASTKDRAENLMILDLMRNDLARVAEPGSVAVADRFAVETYPTVHQMVAEASATLPAGAGLADIFRALFPSGSITGAPKIRAMELIGEVERDARGAYCGAIGWAKGGDAAFNVAIRTLRLRPVEHGRGTAILGVGGGIVADSEAMAERREADLKGAFARTPHAVSGADLIETMRYDPVTGVSRLEQHLERMKASAAELGHSFDRHLARNRIHALCFDLDAPARLRLLCARSGAIALETAPLPDTPSEPATCILLPLPVDPSDWRLRHKTTDRAFYDEAREAAHGAGADEAIFVHPDGRPTEGAVSNLFARLDGARVTPPASLGLLPGVLRRSLLDAGEAMEGPVPLAALARPFEIGNAVAGLRPARLL